METYRDNRVIRRFYKPDWDGHNMLRNDPYDPPQEANAEAVALATAHEVPQESDTVALVPQEAETKFAETAPDGEILERE